MLPLSYLHAVYSIQHNLSKIRLADSICVPDDWQWHILFLCRTISWDPNTGKCAIISIGQLNFEQSWWHQKSSKTSSFSVAATKLATAATIRTFNKRLTGGRRRDSGRRPPSEQRCCFGCWPVRIPTVWWLFVCSECDALKLVFFSGEGPPTFSRALIKPTRW